MPRVTPHESSYVDASKSARNFGRYYGCTGVQKRPIAHITLLQFLNCSVFPNRECVSEGVNLSNSYDRIIPWPNSKRFVFQAVSAVVKKRGKCFSSHQQFNFKQVRVCCLQIESAVARKWANFRPANIIVLVWFPSVWSSKRERVRATTSVNAGGLTFQLLLELWCCTSIILSGLSPKWECFISGNTYYSTGIQNIGLKLVDR